MKTRILLCLVMLFHFHSSWSQHWIGTAFELDTVIRLSENEIPEDLSHLKYKVSKGTFYYTDTKSFQNKANDYKATIYGISLGDYARFQFTLPFPKSSIPTEVLSKTLWINDFHISNDTIAVSVQDYIVQYLINESGHCEYDTMFAFKNVKQVYYHWGELFFLSENHDTGYNWYKIDRNSGQFEHIRTLRYEAPHTVQILPNRYLVQDDHYVYFLSNRYPRFEKYTLDGILKEEIVFDIPNWHPFDDDYIHRSLSFPYGVERIHATMGDAFRYSYPKLLFPIGEDYLLYHTQYDTTSQRAHLQYTTRNPRGECLTYLARNQSDEAYGRDRFPFNLFDGPADKARISWNDRLIELHLGDTLDWDGLDPQTYKQQQELYYRKNKPVPTIRIMTYRDRQPDSQPFFYDSEHSFMSILDLPVGKNVLLINNELECSACRNELFSRLNELDTTIHIGILYPFVADGLQFYELSKEVGRQLQRKHEFYFLDRKRYACYPRYITTVCNAYPSLLLYETGKKPRIFSLDDIFNDDPLSFHFSSKFQPIWEEFISN